MINHKMMKSILIKTILCSFLLLCVSCFKEVDLGFPQKIIFPKGGGEKIVTGKVSFGYAGIEDYRGNSGDIIRGEAEITYTVYYAKVWNIKNFFSCFISCFNKDFCN